MPELNHYFDAYLNSFQSIKDSLETALNEKIDWNVFLEISVMVNL